MIFFDEGGVQNIVSSKKSQYNMEELMDLIASLSTSILSKPEYNLSKLKQLIFLLDSRDEKILITHFISFHKMLSFSILELFKDLLPSYKIIEEMREEKEGKKLSKSVLQLRVYERNLLSLYKLYITRLIRMTQVIKKSKHSNFYDFLDSIKKRERICLIGLKCQSEILISHPHFNFRDQIIRNIVPLATVTRFPKICELACNTLSRLYRQDKLGEVSLEITKEMEKLSKACGLFINPDALGTFLSLNIKEVNKKAFEKKDMEKVRKELRKMSRSERRRNKERLKLDKELMEVEAKENYQKKLDFHTKIVNHIFVTYFRILKRTILDLSEDEIKRKRFKLILSPVLEGLSKFSCLINAEYFDELINILHNLMKSDLLDVNQSLHCNQTVFTIISGEGSILNVDPRRFYTSLYQSLTDVNVWTPTNTIVILLECLASMIIRRKKQITFTRVLAFIKRLSTAALINSDATNLAFLITIRRLLQDHSKSELLLDSEGAGNGTYHSFIEDPENCNPTSTNLWEFHLLQKHPNKVLSKLVFDLSHSKECLMEIAKKTPLDTFESFQDYEYLDEQSNYNIPIKRTRCHGYINKQSSLASRCLNLLEYE